MKEKQGEGEGRRWKTSWLFRPNLHHLDDLPPCGVWLGQQTAMHTTVGLGQIWGTIEKRPSCGLGESILCHPALSIALWWQKCSSVSKSPSDLPRSGN